jgi:hypothetical protein
MYGFEKSTLFEMDEAAGTTPKVEFLRKFKSLKV